MDMTGWIEFFTAGLATQVSEVKKRGETAIRKDTLTQRYSLTIRQALALGYALELGILPPWRPIIADCLLPGAHPDAGGDAIAQGVLAALRSDGDHTAVTAGVYN